MAIRSIITNSDDGSEVSTVFACVEGHVLCVRRRNSSDCNHQQGHKCTSCDFGVADIVVVHEQKKEGTNKYFYA